ncbi:beta-N-acetylhexosaminidase [Corticimicrobacter populi]|uniref:Beta-hexosaminidase n=1 Tax=Corticimicrobacter populi TaxID=2175229 RepID=A0A2V1JZE9_9BURK|nr:beta-N-acetylhexosaminidase [Corticimicrobacter populi]PWF22724.1 beta-N-acetylhexosaminidase [Corticimicrobacter populi]
MPVAVSSSPVLYGPVMADVAGLTLTESERTRLLNPLVGGVILFARNFENRAQLCALTAEIRALGKPLLIAVDHEGGRVQRFRTDGFTHLPSMRSLGWQWARDPMLALRLATEAGYVLAAELRACGVDLSFTPVLDLDYGRSAVIGDRAFHSDPQCVAQLARALIQGLALAGMAACGKHFPGHGHVEADSHLAIPVDERSLDDILALDAAPYGWLGDQVLPSVMPAHVIYSSVDPNPAGFSRFWVQTILRERLGYDGVVFSDDLTMEGATVAGDILARAQAALGAGCDMVLVCNRPDLADELLARLDVAPDPVASARIARLAPRSDAPDWDALQSDPRYRHARSLQHQSLAG